MVVGWLNQYSPCQIDSGGRFFFANAAILRAAAFIAQSAESHLPAIRTSRKRRGAPERYHRTLARLASLPPSHYRHEYRNYAQLSVLRRFYVYRRPAQGSIRGPGQGAYERLSTMDSGAASQTGAKPAARGVAVLYSALAYNMQEDRKQLKYGGIYIVARGRRGREKNRFLDAAAFRIKVEG